MARSRTLNPFRQTIVNLREANGVQFVSPIGLSLVAIIPLILSMLFPVSLYEEILKEPNLMFGNYQLLLFYMACIGCHILGCLALKKPVRRLAVSGAEEYKSFAWRMIAAPLACVFILDSISLMMIVANNPHVISMVLSGHGDEAKQNLDVRGALGGAQPLLTAVTWWAAMRLHLLRGSLHRNVWRNLRYMIYACVALGTMVALFKMARYEVMPLYLGLIIIKARQAGSGKSAWFFLGVGMGAIAFISVLFVVFALFRGQDLLLTLAGYGPASFNHLAAVLDGRIQYPSDGIYTIGFLDSLPLMKRFTGSTELTASALQFLKEFDLTHSAGMNGAMIWITAWGYYYVDLGWGVLPFAFATGCISQLAWNAFNRGNAIGLVLYPFFASALLLWSTFYVMCRPQTPIIVFAAVALLAWERLIDWRKPQSNKEAIWNKRHGPTSRLSPRR